MSRPLIRREALQEVKAMSLNRIMVIGHVGQDPEIRYTPTGMPVVNFSVATDETYVDKEGKREERTEWHRAVVVGKLALTCHAYLKKGQQVFVDGPLRTREWESNGRSSRRVEIIVRRVQFLGTPPAGPVESAQDENLAVEKESERTS
jgi:single-strand DNA-binding protein